MFLFFKLNPSIKHLSRNVRLCVLDAFENLSDLSRAQKRLHLLYEYPHLLGYYFENGGIKASLHIPVCCIKSICNFVKVHKISTLCFPSISHWKKQVTPTFNAIRVAHLQGVPFTTVFFQRHTAAAGTKIIRFQKFLHW